MTSGRNGRIPPAEGESGGPKAQDMAHPDPKVIQAKRQMAHPVRRKPLTPPSGGLAALLPNTSDPGLYGASARFVARLKPRQGRRRWLAVAMAAVVVAAALAAGMPGGWSGAASASPSPDLANGAPVDPTHSPTPSISADPASPDPTPSAAPSASATPTMGPTITPPAAPPTKPVIKIFTFVTLGDSLTSGYGDPGPAWPVRLDAEDANLRLVHNSGVVGDKTADMWNRLNKDVFAYDPNVLFILGGTNDLGHGYGESATISNLKAIILAARAKSIHIFMMTIPPDSYAGMAGKIDSLNAAIVHLANDYRIVVIDIHAALSTASGVYVPKYTVDGLHFSAAGAQVVANTVYARIHRLGY
jgi:lysophospholipase L1-like esterase